MEAQLIETIEREGLPAVDFLDASKKLAGDRWQVTLMVRMRVPVTESLGDLPAPIAEVRHRIGETVVFEHKISRTFISGTEKEALLGHLAEDFKATALAYLYHDHFQKNLIAKRYRDQLTQDYLYKDG